MSGAPLAEARVQLHVHGPSGEQQGCPLEAAVVVVGVIPVWCVWGVQEPSFKYMYGKWISEGGRTLGNMIVVQTSGNQKAKTMLKFSTVPKSQLVAQVTLGD